MANGYNDEFFNGDDQSQSLENDAREIGDIAKDVKNIADKVKDHRGKDANEDTNGTNAGSKNVPSGANNVGGANQVQPNAAQAGGDAAANMSTSGAPGGDVAAGSGAASNAGASAGTGTTVGASGGAEAGAAAAGAGSATASGGAAAAEAGGAAAGSAASAGAAAGGAAAGGAAAAGGTGCAVVGGGCLVVVGGIILLFALLYIIILPVNTLIYGAEAVGDGITSWSQRVGQDLSIAKYDFMIDMYNISSALENFAFHILHPGQAAATDEILAELDEKELTLASDDFAPEYTDTTNSMVTTLDGAFRQGWARTVQTAEYRAGLISATVAEGSGTVTDGYDSEELWNSSEFWADTSNWSSGDDYYQQGDWTPTPSETYQGQPTGEKVTISVRTIPDIDADGIPDNFVDEDANGNGVLDEGEDLNGNGVLDTNEDENGNGILDAGEDINGNGLLDMADTEVSEPCYMDAIIKLIALQNCAEQSILLDDDEDGNIKQYGVDATFSDDSIVGDENASVEEKMKSTEYQLLRLGGEIAGRGIQRQDLNSEQEFDSIYQIVTETKVTETPIVHDVEIRYKSGSHEEPLLDQYGNRQYDYNGQLITHTVDDYDYKHDHYEVSVNVTVTTTYSVILRRDAKDMIAKEIAKTLTAEESDAFYAAMDDYYAMQYELLCELYGIVPYAWENAGSPIGGSGYPAGLTPEELEQLLEELAIDPNSARGRIVSVALASVGKFTYSQSNGFRTGVNSGIYSPGNVNYTGTTHDCSSFVQYCYFMAGVPLSPTNTSGYASAIASGELIEISPSEVQPGDLQVVYPNGYEGHVWMYVGNGNWCECTPDGGVRADNWSEQFMTSHPSHYVRSVFLQTTE